MPADEKGPDPCAKLQGLIERQVIDRSELSVQETLFIEEHVRQCPQCAAFSQALDLLGTAPGTDTIRQDAIVARTLATLKRRRRTRRLLALSGAAVAMAATVLLLVFHPWRDPPMTAPLPLRVASGTVEVSGIRLGPGEEIEEGARVRSASPGALLESGPHLTMGVDGETRFRVERWGEEVRIHLEKGTVTCRLDGWRGSGMVVSFPGGRAIPTGTFFAVHAADEWTRIDVMAGTVRIHQVPESGERLLLEAGSSVTLPEGTTRPLDSQRRKDVVALLRPRGDITSRPVDILPGPSTTGPSSTPMDETPHQDDPPAPAQGAVSKTADTDRKTSSSPTLTDLLEKARGCRKSKDWKCAAKAYQLIRTEYAERPEAVTVLVPLAQIELAHLEQADGALAHFDLYLQKRPEGNLAQEALLGKARALQALGRTTEEVAALELFLDLYPASVQASSVQSRLDVLGQ